MNTSHPQSVPGHKGDLPSSGDAAFDAAIRFTLRNEGIWSDDPDDPGGATMYGISLRFAKGLGDLDGDGKLDLDLDRDGDVDEADMRLVTLNIAVQKYKQVFWDPYPYDRLPLAVAIKVFDFGVNMGSKQSHKILQQAVRAASSHRLVEDGILGKKSLEAIRACDEKALLASYRAHAAGFYRTLASKRPRSRKYLNGWLNRAYS